MSSYQTYTYSIIAILTLLLYCVYCDEKISKDHRNLTFVQVLYRHGDRTPLRAYKNDPYSDVSNYPVSWGQLTNLGKQQHYELGKWLRKRYQAFLNSEEYSVNLTYVRSTDVDRAIMSALANLAGLFPPNQNQEWNTNITWQPIPVHTIPENLDYVLAGKKKCPEYDLEYNLYLQSDEFKKLNESFKDLMEYLSISTGEKMDNFPDILTLYGTLIVQETFNKTLPEWTKKVYPGGDFHWIATHTFKLQTQTPSMKRLLMGFLVKEIFERFENKSKSILDPNRSMWIYSAHDTTVARLLNSLGLYEPHIPPYTACILFELHMLNDIPYIQILYKNSTVEPEPLILPNCGTLCPLAKMYELYNDIIPGDFDDECKMKKENLLLLVKNENNSKQGILITGIVLFTFLAFALTTLAIKNWCSRRKSYGPTKRTDPLA